MIDDAVRTVERDAEDDKPEPITVTVTMTPDGGLTTRFSGQPTAGFLWGASAMLAAIADDMFRTTIEAQRERQRAMQPQVLVPKR